jgi:hypothetical protein
MSFELFADDDKLLPAFCKPYADEILSSWLTRMAFCHGLTTVEFCKYALCRNLYASYDIDRIIKPKTIMIIAEKTDCTPREVEATTLRWYVNKLYTPSFVTNASEMWLLPSEQVRDYKKHTFYHRSGLMFCPLCLKTKIYFRKQWRLTLSLVCLDCGCYLLDRCPHCKKGNSFMEVDSRDFLKGNLDHYLLNCHHCKQDVTDCNIEMASEEILHLQQKLYNLVESNTENPLVSKKSYLRVLSFLCRLLLNPLKGGFKLSNFVHDVYQLNNLPFNRWSKVLTDDLRRVTVRKRADMVAMAAWLLEKWPGRFISLCQNNEVRQDHVLKLFPSAPIWFRGPIYWELAPRKQKTFLKDSLRPAKEYTARPKMQPFKIMEDETPERRDDEDELFYEPKCLIEHYKKCLMKL